MRKFFALSFIALLGFTFIGCDFSQASNTSNTVSDTAKVFTLSELSQYTGANGSTAYIAVNGVVYDVTNVFVNGTHQGLQLGGTDATSAFASSPHSAALLDTLPVVGVLQTNTSLTSTENNATTTTNSSTTTSDQQTLPVFTLDQLSQYTGANGSTAYIAVYGVIYDVTAAFTNGTHQGIQLGGTDATAVFESSPHSMSQLALLPVVGSLEGYALITVNSSTNANTTQSNTTDDDHDDDTENEFEDDDLFDD